MERENINPWKLQIENMQREFVLGGSNRTESEECTDNADVKNEMTLPPEDPLIADENRSQIAAVKEKCQVPTVANGAAETKKEENVVTSGPFQCDVCKETIETTVAASHFNGKSHRRKMELMFMEKCVKKDKCDLCGTTFQSLVQIFDHYNGFDHAVKLVASKPNRANRSLTALPPLLGINLTGRGGSRGASASGASGGGKLKRGGSRGVAKAHGRGSSTAGGRGGRGQGGFGSRGRAGVNVRGRGAGIGGQSSWGSNVNSGSNWQSNKPGNRGGGRGSAFRRGMRGGRGGRSNNIGDRFPDSSWAIEQMLDYPQNEGGGKMLLHDWQQSRLTPYGDSSFGSQFQQELWGAGQYDAEDDFMSWF